MGQLRKSKTVTQYALSSLHMLEQTGERVSHVGALVTHEVADKVRNRYIPLHTVAHLG